MLGMRRRVVLVAGTLVVVGVAGAGVLLTQDTRASLESYADATLLAQATTLSTQLGDRSLTTEGASAWAADLGTRVMEIDASGVVTIDSAGQGVGQEARLIPGLAGLSPSDLSTPSALSPPGAPVRAAIAPRPGQPVRVVALAREVPEVAAAVHRVTQHVLWAGVFALAAVAYVVWVTTRVVSRTLTDLVNGVQAVARGERGVRVSPSDAEVFGGLAGSINQLAESLEGTVSTLAAERSRFETMLERLSDAVIALDHEERVTMVNRGATRLFGFDRSPIGQTLLETVRLPVLAELVRRARTEGRVKAEVDWTSGRRRRLLARATRLGQGEGTVLVIQDLTALRRLETVRRDFVANVSHELRTPVGVILANAETLLDGALDDPKFSRTFVEALHRNAIRLTRLLDDLLDISRLEAGQAHLAPERFDLTEVAAQVIDALSVKAGEKSIDLQWSGDAPVWVRADANAVEQVLVNLIDNAIKYTPSGSRVLVGTAAQEDAGRIRVVIEDNGPGIDAQHRERIFERFYRVDPGRSREMGGTGLGLSIVRHLVESMGGSVGVEPATPTGARFWFTLPAQTEASLAAEATS